MVVSLTRSQVDVVRIIDELTGILGRPPSVREIAQEYGASKGQMHDMLQRIAARGWFHKGDPGEGYVLKHELRPLPDCHLVLTPAGRAFLPSQAFEKC